MSDKAGVTVIVPVDPVVGMHGRRYAGPYLSIGETLIGCMRMRVPLFIRHTVKRTVQYGRGER